MWIATPPLEKVTKALVSKAARPDERSGQHAVPPTPGAPVAQERSGRLLSLDAYRGFIMLAMASSALGFTQVASKKEVIERFAGSACDAPWRFLWETLAYQFDHVAWTGCAFGGLIQPSFMFMVGVAMPFAFARRTAQGDSWGRQLCHALMRAFNLTLIGILLDHFGADKIQLG